MITENQMVRTDTEVYMFERDPDGSWYIVLPEWDGPRADLLMVAGADKMLETLAEGEDTVSLQLDTKPFTTSDITLSKVVNVWGGATYFARTPMGSSPIWLCKVTKFVFNGDLPKRIYAKVVKERL